MSASLGSGDIGLIMARRMTLEGAHVEAVFEILPYSSGLPRNIQQCLNDYGIPLFLSTTVTEIRGEKRLEGIKVAQVGEDRAPILETERYIPCDTLLLSVGLIPENEADPRSWGADGSYNWRRACRRHLYDERAGHLLLRQRTACA